MAISRTQKVTLSYGIFQPIQIASIIALRDCADEPSKIRAMQQRRRDVFTDELRTKAHWGVEVPGATMFLNARIPERFRSMGSVAFSKWILENAHVASAAGMGFIHGTKIDKVSRRLGEEYVRFALIENEQRLRQAARNIGRAFRGETLIRSKVLPASGSDDHLATF